MPQSHDRLQFTVLGSKHVEMWQILDKIWIVDIWNRGNAHWGDRVRPRRNTQCLCKKNSGLS